MVVLNELLVALLSERVKLKHNTNNFQICSPDAIDRGSKVGCPIRPVIVMII